MASKKITGQKRQRIIDRDEGRCYLCGLLCVEYKGQKHGYQEPDALTIDHVVAIHRGGTNRESNLAVACARCNHSKSSLGFGDERGLERLRHHLLYHVPPLAPVPYTRSRRSRRRKGVIRYAAGVWDSVALPE